MSTFYAKLKKTGLPDYAMPRLVRITKEYDPFLISPYTEQDVHADEQ
jgi:hypothetical protein